MGIETPERLRERFRQWLQTVPLEAPEGRVGEDPEGYEFRRRWQRAYHQAGFVGLTWPEEFGGAGLTMEHQAVVLEEIARRSLPTPLNIIGINMVGPTIITHGTPAQQARYLRPILTGEEIWCQGFSEPEAGSDIAAIRTRARPSADGTWTISGQKIWTSLSPIADHCLLLARTDDAPRGHSGLACFLLPMDADGVTVRPIRDVLGEEPFGEIFLDDVVVDGSAVLGRADAGWDVVVTTLGYERANLGVTLGADAMERFGSLLDLLHGPLREQLSDAELDNASVRLGHLGSDVRALQLTSGEMLSELAPGAVPGPEGTVLKMKWAQVNQQMVALAVDLLGEAAVVGAHVPGSSAERWMPDYLRSLANTIEGGTSEVLRSLVAERVLGLPRTR